MIVSDIFMDLDESLVLVMFEAEHNFTPKPNALGVIEFPEMNAYGNVFLRPDAHLLKPYPFNIFTAGTADYAAEVADLLDDAGFNITGVYSREIMEDTDPNGPPPLSVRISVLIDNMPIWSGLAQSKMEHLPHGMYCQVAELQGVYDDRNELIGVEIDPDSDGMSLKRCLEYAVQRSH